MNRQQRILSPRMDGIEQVTWQRLTKKVIGSEFRIHAESSNLILIARHPKYH